MLKPSYQHSRVAPSRPITRGNAVRVILYMHAEYGFSVPAEMLPVLTRWNREGPPSCGETRWKNRIEALQGTRNRFIDHP